MGWDLGQVVGGPVSVVDRVGNERGGVFFHVHELGLETEKLYVCNEGAKNVIVHEAQQVVVARETV